MSLVWERFPSGGNELLAMLALADWSNDHGANCHPSMATIARKLRVTRSSAQRTVHRLIDAGWLQVVSGHTGGAPGTTRHYRINLEKLASTGSVDATPTGRTDATGSTNATGSTSAAEGSHGCIGTGSTGATQTIIEPSLTVKTKARTRADAFEEEAEVLAFLNEHAGRQFEAFDADGKPSKALQVIRGALKRITPLEARRIVILKTREWGDNPDMRKHINPMTLYGRKANLEKYLAEVREAFPERRAP